MQLVLIANTSGRLCVRAGGNGEEVVRARTAAVQYDITLTSYQAILRRRRFRRIAVRFPACIGAVPEKEPASGVRVGAARVGLEGNRRTGLCTETAESHGEPGHARQFEELASAHVLDVLVHMSSERQILLGWPGCPRGFAGAVKESPGG